MRRFPKMTGSTGVKGAAAGEKTEKCCGDCRFCREGSGESLRCMRHKIETGFACLCGDWLRKTAAD